MAVRQRSIGAEHWCHAVDDDDDSLEPNHTNDVSSHSSPYQMPPSLATALSTNLFHSPCFLGLIVPNRLFTFTRARLKKEIRYSVEGNRTTIEGVHVPSERSGKVLCLDGLGDPRDTDPISRLDLNLTHTDVRILSQFLRPDGTILPRKISGISLRSQLLVELLIERARKSGEHFDLHMLFLIYVV
ncbi:hypothetical protein CSKR_108689 [Clonorchis sinensis]|uniref:Uncharacterized protein n=1 Tax=Clonorchis sinensis TaxID=79923 RepID=A0A8T1MYD6_CLOSI|nr:hypothetical protein CSKR_108689 [Clonorchis sinensis]